MQEFQFLQENSELQLAVISCFGVFSMLALYTLGRFMFKIQEMEGQVNGNIMTLIISAVLIHQFTKALSFMYSSLNLSFHLETYDFYTLFFTLSTKFNYISIILYIISL